MLVGSVHHNRDLSETWDTLEPMPYKEVIRALFAIGQLSSTEYAELMHINAVRNKMIHQIFKEPYEIEHKGFPKLEYDRIVQRAEFWVERIREKTEEIIE